jgi:hypothetical protein
MTVTMFEFDNMRACAKLIDAFNTEPAGQAIATASTAGTLHRPWTSRASTAKSPFDPPDHTIENLDEVAFRLWPPSGAA